MTGPGRWLCLLLLGLAPAASFASAAQVWPSKARRLDDGRVEYVYDLRPLKAGRVPIDLGPDADDAAVAAFRKALPPETRVVVSPGESRLRMDAPGGLEEAPLSSSFAGCSDGAFRPGPSASRPAASGLPALHPDAPKLLVSADLVLWRQQLLQDEIEAGLLEAFHFGGLAVGRRAVFEQIFDAAVERSKRLDGDARLGARRLAGRLAALMAGSSGRLPEAARTDPEIASRVRAEAEQLFRPRPLFPPRPMYGWSPRLAEAREWDLGLAAPLGTDREGVAAALTLLAILEGDPALAKDFAALRAERDRIFAAPADDWLELFRAALGEGGASAALGAMDAFLARLGDGALRDGHGPALLPEPRTPVGRFIDGLERPEQLHAIDELTLAVEDGRVLLDAPAGAGWCAGRDAWRRELLRTGAAEEDRIVVTGEYADRLTRTFQALYGMDGEVASADEEPLTQDEVGVARVRLMVPPLLEVEPLPGAWARAADAWARLGALASSDRQLSRVYGLFPGGGRRASSIAQDAAAHEKLLRGLSLLAALETGAPPPASPRERASLAAARRFVSTWRSDPELGRDVRFLLPVGEAPEPGRVVHSGVLGVGRRELLVSFEGSPSVAISAKDPSLFEADTSAVQRYQVPVLVTGSVTVPRADPLEPSELRALCDRVGRSREAILSALPEALVKTMTPVGADAP